MDTISLRTSITPYKGESDIVLLPEILVNNDPLVNWKYNEVGVDLGYLTETLHRTGEFFIVTCSCGDAGCAGIEEGIKVSRDVDNVRWKVPGYWGPARVLVFEGKAYDSAIESSIQQFKQLRAQNPQLETVPINTDWAFD